jgi:SAGA-associated factor 29
MSRARVLSGRASVETEHAMTEAWHRFIDTLRGMERQDGGADMDRRAALSQKERLDTAIDQITALIDLRRTTANGGETPRASPGPGDGLLTPPSGVKRKRRPSVMSASPAPPTQGSELSSLPSPQVRSGTPARDPKRARTDADQLPLRSGRKIVVKQKSGAHGGKGKEEEDEWILGIVRKAVGDKRYEVQDADDTSLRWTARLRDILLLPDPDAPTSSSSHPSNLEDFPRGTQVLALYPETTSFYRATVVSPPIPGTGMGRTARGARPDASAKAGQYRLAFVDDGDSVLHVDKGYVIMHPGDR